MFGSREEALQQEGVVAADDCCTDGTCTLCNSPTMCRVRITMYKYLSL